jgi:hypothetical protein
MVRILCKSGDETNVVEMVSGVIQVVMDLISALKNTVRRAGESSERTIFLIPHQLQQQ